MSTAEGPWDIDNETSGRSASVIQIETFGKGGVAVLMASVIVGLVIATLAFGYAGRAMDRATIAEREARIAQDKYTYVMGELAKKGIYITTDGH